MIEIENISTNILRIVVPEKLRADDFYEIAPKVDAIIRQHKRICLMIDASKFKGWENIAALEKHVGFVKDHQNKIARIAVIAPHDWQHWLIGTVKIFVHPEIRAYEIGQEREALQWIGSESTSDGR